MPGREPQLQTQAPGGVPAARYTPGVSPLAALGHWKPVGDLREKRGLQGLQVAHPRDRQIPWGLLRPAQGAGHQHLRAPGRPAPPPPMARSPAAAPRVSSVPRVHHRPVSPSRLPASRRPRSRPTLRSPFLLLFFRLRLRSPALRQPR